MILDYNNFKPCQGNILVKLDEFPDKTKGGIVIPDTMKKNMQFGTVIMIGNGEISKKGKYILSELSSGDKILFNKYDGIKINFDNKKEDYRIVKEKMVWCIVKQK